MAHYHFGYLFNPDRTIKFCSPAGQLLKNFSFDCGTKYWGFSPLYPAIITNNGDGSLHLKADSEWGSLVPEIEVFTSSDYILECKVRNVVGTGKMSIRKTDDTWVNSPDITSDGIYTFEYTGNIKEIHCGANSDQNYEADYDYISLRDKNSNIVTYLGDTVRHIREVVTYG